MIDINASIRAALVAHPVVASQLGDRIALNAAGESLVAPYAVYRVNRQQERGLAGNLLGEVCTIEVQVWARQADRCIVIGDAVTEALYNYGALVTRRVTGYDADGAGLDYESIEAVYPI